MPFSAFDSAGVSLPLHCNYDRTETGLMVPWKGGETGNQHEVICKATDSDWKSSTCAFTVIVKGTLYIIFRFTLLFIMFFAFLKCDLTLSQTTNFRLFQTQSVCRQQFQT